MGKKKKTPFQIKRERIEARIHACDVALAKARTLAKSYDTGNSKRKTINVLSRYIAVPVDGNLAIRDCESFKTRTYNLGKQVIGVVNHTFGRYPVPMFLYKAILSREGVAEVFRLEDLDQEVWREAGKRRFVKWFITAAQGGSLAKEMKELLTKKEVHWFLQAPMQNSIQRNLFWAKCATAGIPAKDCQFLTEQIGSKKQQSKMGRRMDDVIRFYATESGFMRRNDLKELTDFVRAMISEPEFSFKGRTYSSMVKLSNDWHNSIYSTNVTVNRCWPQTFAPWIHEKKEHSVVAMELTSSRALADEGRRQRHCVFSYETDCLRNWAKIISFRWFVPLDTLMHQVEYLNRITVEVCPRDRQITQIRGRCNRMPDDLEMKVIRLWAGQHGLTISQWA